MEEMISKLTAETGIDQATAEKVVDFIKQHAGELPKWLGESGLAERLPANLGETAAAFLK